MNNDIAEATAKRRFFMLGLVRLACLALVLIGIAIAQGAIAAPREAGIAAAFIGLAGFFFLPNRLAAKWRSNDT